MWEAPPIDTDGAQGAPGTNVDSVDRPENVFGTGGAATEYFAAPTYRPYQRQVIETIEESFEQGYRYIIVDAPTGSGKSHISRAFAFQSNDAHILTVQKLLQDQYQSDFPDMYVMKGRNAYQCRLSSEGKVSELKKPLRKL